MMDHDEDDPFAGLFSESGRAERGPPRRDPWDEYAIEKVDSHLSGEEFYLDDQNGYCWAYGVFSLVAIGAAIYQGSKTDAGGEMWNFVFGLLGVVLFFSCIVVRIYNGFLFRRISRQRKQIERFGLRHL